MSKQKHDIGNRKRQQAATNRTSNNQEPSSETLAVKLVDRGLCSQNILERPYKPNRSE